MDRQSHVKTYKPIFTIYQNEVPIFTVRSESKAAKYVTKMSLLAQGSTFKVGG